MTNLTQRVLGAFSRQTAFADPLLQTGAISVNQDNYSTDPDSTVLDRVYDVKGLSNMHVAIKNTGGTNGLTYKITNTEKEFTDITTLVDADFDEVIKADTIVAFGAKDTNDIVDISPESTAIRILVKRQTTLLNTTLAGFVSAN